MNINIPKNHLAQLKMQKAHLREHMAALAATEADVTQVTEDADNLEAIIEFQAAGRKFVQTQEKIFKIMTEGLQEGEEMPVQPEPPVLTLPYPPVKTGMRDRSEVRNRRFRAAPGYTREIGIALGLYEK